MTLAGLQFPPGICAISALVVLLAAGTIGARSDAETVPEGTNDPASRSTHQVLPVPVSFLERAGETYELTAASRVVLAIDDADVAAVGERFASRLRRSTGFELPVVTGSATAADIGLSLQGAAELGEEGYTLAVGDGGADIVATTAEGLFRGLTSFRQMLPTAAESTSVESGPWIVNGADITDRPRFEYRGLMLDVARHFFDVAEVLRLIDNASRYKVNHLHLHLTDDQGWRFPVPARPLLVEVGGANDVEGNDAGAYTEEDFATIIRYAAEHYIEVVPEIDMPGHSIAAMNAYPELTCDGVAPGPYTTFGVPPASLCVTNESVYDLLGDVFDAVVTQSPGQYIHIGGDEAEALGHDDYVAFIERTTGLVAARGRTVIVWHEAAVAPLPMGAVVQYWGQGEPQSTGLVRDAAAAGHPVLLSPSGHSYYDMKYERDTPYGLCWAGFIPLSVSYDWDPGALIRGLPESSIIGVEATLWSENIHDRQSLDYMTFPRLASIAEVGWSPASELSWDDFRIRVAAQGPRWEALGVNYYRSPEVVWPTDTDAVVGEPVFDIPCA